MKFRNALVLLCLLAAMPARADPPAAADPDAAAAAAADPDAAAAAALKALTAEEKRALLRGYLAIDATKPSGAIGSAGYVPGVPRLKIPALQETDATLGIANPKDVRPGNTALALPSGLAMAAGFDPNMSEQLGEVLGREAAARGFNVLLGPGINLTREPRGGRNFEYFGEDPLLAGTLAGAMITGIQSQHVIATAKHFALNDQESGRDIMDVRLPENQARESDLLAFEIALARGRPGAVMCAYNKVGGIYACGNRQLLTQTLKEDWHFPGFVMSDWGAVHAATDLAAGLDQESAAEMDPAVYVGQPLNAALGAGSVSAARVDDAARRVLRAMAAAGLLGSVTKPIPDPVADLAVARAAETDGIVLLRNESSTLPLARDMRCLAVIGGNSDAGVPAGGGSSQVTPLGGYARRIDLGGEGPGAWARHAVWDPPAPRDQLRKRLPHTHILWADGRYPSQAAALAAVCPAAVIFAEQWSGEANDIPGLGLPAGQDALIDAVTRVNAHTVVVLETAGPVLMPWLQRTGAVLEAWYGGNGGADAIADLLLGDSGPSGRLPMTFPAQVGDLPDVTLNGQYLQPGIGFAVTYREGSDAGYRWYGRTGTKPLFPFGFGLTGTQFAYANLTVSGGTTIAASFQVTNTGKRPGTDVPQLYLTARGETKILRLLGFQRVTLKPGGTAFVTLRTDPRLLADYVPLLHGWHVPGGPVTVAVGANAGDLPLDATAALDDRRMPP